MNMFKATHKDASGKSVQMLDEHITQDGTCIITYYHENGEIGAMASVKFHETFKLVEPPKTGVDRVKAAQEAMIKATNELRFGGHTKLPAVVVSDFTGALNELIEAVVGSWPW